MKLGKAEFRERILKKLERRKQGKREAQAFRNETWGRTRDAAYRASRTSQNAN